MSFNPCGLPSSFTQGHLSIQFSFITLKLVFSNLNFRLMDTSPVICLNMLEPQIKVDLNEFDVKTPENIRLNYVEGK